MTRFITSLHNKFAIKDLGTLNYFLGLEASSTTDGIFLCQSKYATEVLQRADLLDCKPVSTPLVVNESLTANGVLHPDPTLYRSLIGPLKYLTITRPDISYAVNHVSQFLQAPTITHFKYVKWILRYVKGPVSYGLVFSRPSTTTVLGYSNTD
ncbi:uncharacterized mitochondrial protein AtMg00810-like [Helianthus annuus]|uniref:uncharacterized mitochondrial protein AtMg00810-like n=1 Tax=Helianthus annuus TaxID=4232 RepID=UPI000B8FA15F|nr:uncharacterized mitochondrial protein AtMg00810-like [Helianthus annuus]